MRTGVVFGQEIEFQTEALDLGVEVIRFDLGVHEAPQWLHDTLYRMKGVPIVPWVVFQTLEQAEANLADAVDLLGPTGFIPSMFNEPDLANESLADRYPPDGRVPEQAYIDTVQEFGNACIRAGFTGTKVAGGISNLDSDSFDYLERTIGGVPLDIATEFHLYPIKYQFPEPSHFFGESNAQVIERFKRIVAPRPFLVGEFGFNQGPRDPLPRLNEEDIYRVLKQWYRMFHEAGAEVACVYQWRDGDTDDAMGTFGIHYADGITRKRQAAALKGWKDTGGH